MAADKDYVLGVAVQLQTESVAAFEAEVRRQLENAATNIEKKPFKVKIQTQFEGMNSSQVQQMTRDYDNLSSSITKSAGTMNDLGAAAKKASAEVKSAAVQAKTEIQGFFDSASGRALDNENSDLFGVRNLKAQLSEYKATVAQMADEHRQINEMLSANTAFQDRQRELRGIGASWDQNLISGTDGAMLEKQQRLLDKYAPALNNATQAQKGFAEQMFATSGAADHFIKSMGNIATWTIGATALFAAGGTVVKGFQDAIRSQQEQVIQGFYYKAQGQNFSPQMSNTTMQGAIDLARKYGDDVMEVQEAIGLWAKSVKGEVLPSLAMANEALKLNSVTGMKNEEIYRSTISTLSQYHQAISRANDLYNVGVGLATRYGGGIKSLGGEAQDATRQMIEAMDASSAVASSFGLKMEQTAGLLAVMIQTGNKSGETTGNMFSRAMTAFEKGKPEEALQKMGIAIHDNSKFLDELKEKWDKVVPGMGDTLGNIVSRSVAPSANEALKLMIGSLGQYQEAVKQAYEYEKSHPLDEMYKQMKDTDAFKLNQLKASFESISIVIGRHFLDPLNKAMDAIQKAVPQIMSLGKPIADIAKDLMLLGAGWGAIEALKLLGNAAYTAGQQWGNLAAFYRADAAAIVTASQTASLALSAEQKQAIATLTGNATVTSEMSAQWRSLAAAQGVSVDAMIEQMARLKADTQIGAASIIISEDSIATNMKSVAAQLGVEETQVATAFSGMATSAESAASIMGTAFTRLIPVIGQVLLFAGLAKAAYDGIHDNMNKADAFNYEHNPFARRTREIQLNHLIANDTYELQGDQQALKSYMARGMDTRGVSGLISGVQARIASERAELQDLISGRAWTQYESIDQQLAAQKAALQKSLNDTKLTPPGGNEGGSPTDPGAVKAATQALDSQSQAIKRNVDAWASKISADEKGIQTARLEIQYLKDHKKALDDLTQAYEKTKNDIGSRIRVDQLAIGQFSAMASSAKNEPQRQRFLNEANKLSGEVNNLKAELALLDAKENADVAKAQATEVKGHFEAAMAGVKISMKGISTDSIPQLQALHKTINDLLYTVDQLATKFKGTALGNTLSTWATTLAGDLTTVDDKTKTLNQDLTSFLSTKTEDFQTALSGNQFELANIGRDSTAKAFAQAVTTATDKYDKFIQEWDKWESKAGDTAALENVKSLATAWYQSSIALAQYNQALEQAKASPTYAAITALGNDIGSTVSSDVMAMFTQGDRNQISAIQSQITALQNEKNLLTGQNNIVERDMLDRKIKQLEAEKNGIDQRMQHPNFLKAIQEDMVKAIMKGLTDKFTKSLQDAFLNSILPKQQTVQDKANTFINDNTSATQHNTQALSALTNSIRNSGSSSSGFSLGSVPAAGSFFSDMGMSGSAASVSSGGSVGSNGSTSASSSSLPTLGSGSATIGTSPIGGFAAMGSGAMMAAMLSSGSNPLAPILGMNAAVPQSKSSSLNDIIPSSFNVANTGGSSGGSGGGFWSSGKGNAQHIMGAIAGLSTAVQGYDQGGFTGSLESGLGMFEALSSMGVPPQIAIPVAAVDFLLSMFHPHYNPSQNPDMFPQSGFAQGVANAQGFAATQATGGVYEDPGLKQQLGGMTQLQYLNAWYNKYPGGQGLNEQGKQLWDEIGHITGNGKGYGVTGLHQGNVFVSTSGQNGSPQVGESGNWQQVLQDIDSATNQLYSLENQDMSGKGTWISVNSYGAGGGGSASFSPWSTPGLSSSDVGSVMAMPYPALGSNASIGTSIGPNPGSPSGGIGGGGYGGVNGPGVAPMSVTSNVYLNSDLIAQQVNSYNIQRTTSGFSQNY